MSYETILNIDNIQQNFEDLKYYRDEEEKKEKLNEFKDKIKNINNPSYKLEDKTKLDTLLNTDITQLIESSIPNSFALKINFKLKTPYYSKDDDEFYIIANPCLKEKVFKVPMIRGSGWKGAILHSAIEILKEEPTFRNIESFFRIFGVGNDEFRKLCENIDENRIKTFFALNFAIKPKDDLKEIFNKYKKSKAQKGRAIFYPTYFKKLSLEVINPHSRKTKAGTNPIYFEVVPKGEKGVLQIVYIPFDGIMKEHSKIRQQAKQDFNFLYMSIKKLSENGVVAKTKLGWGQFNIEKIRLKWSKNNVGFK